MRRNKSEASNKHQKREIIKRFCNLTGRSPSDVSSMAVMMRENQRIMLKCSGMVLLRFLMFSFSSRSFFSFFFLRDYLRLILWSCCCNYGATVMKVCTVLPLLECCRIGWKIMKIMLEVWGIDEDDTVKWRCCWGSEKRRVKMNFREWENEKFLVILPEGEELWKVEEGSREKDEWRYIESSEIWESFFWWVLCEFFSGF